MLIEKGMIVKSIAGRDQNRFFLVLDTDEVFAYIADGCLRPLEHPKKKRVKHLARTNETADIAEAATNRRLRKLLAAYNGPSEETGG